MSRIVPVITTAFPPEHSPLLRSLEGIRYEFLMASFRPEDLLLTVRRALRCRRLKLENLYLRNKIQWHRTSHETAYWLGLVRHNYYHCQHDAGLGAQPTIVTETNSAFFPIDLTVSSAVNLPIRSASLGLVVVCGLPFSMLSMYWV